MSELEKLKELESIDREIKQTQDDKAVYDAGARDVIKKLEARRDEILRELAELRKPLPLFDDDKLIYCKSCGEGFYSKIWAEKGKCPGCGKVRKS